MKSAHKHIVCQDDAKSELYELFLSAKDLYLKEVVGNHMRISCFVEMFYDSHYYIDCECALCKNTHRMNLGIVRRVLCDSPHLIEEILLRDSFSRKDLDLLVKLHQTLPEASPAHKPKISFGCTFSEEQFCSLVETVTRYSIFCNTTEADMADKLHSLFDCKAEVRLEVTSVRKVAALFDALLECNFINRDWQTVLGKGGFLISGKSGKQISSSALSSALYKIKLHSQAVYQSIRKDVIEMKRNELSDNR